MSKSRGGSKAIPGGVAITVIDLAANRFTFEVDPAQTQTVEKLRQNVARRWHVPGGLVALEELRGGSPSPAPVVHTEESAAGVRNPDRNLPKVDFAAIKAEALMGDGAAASPHFRVIIRQPDPFLEAKAVDDSDDESPFTLPTPDEHRRLPSKNAAVAEEFLVRGPQRGMADEEELAFLLCCSLNRCREFLYLFPEWRNSLSLLCHLLRVSDKSGFEIARARFAAAIVEAAPVKSQLFDPSLLVAAAGVGLQRDSSAVGVGAAGRSSRSGSLLGVERRLSQRLLGSASGVHSAPTTGELNTAAATLSARKSGDTVSEPGVFLRIYERWAPTLMVAVLGNPLFRQYNWTIRKLGQRTPGKQVLVRSFGVAEVGNKSRFPAPKSREEREEILVTLVKNVVMKSPAAVLNYSEKARFFLARNRGSSSGPSRPETLDESAPLLLPRSTIAPLFELPFLHAVAHLVLSKREEALKVHTLLAVDLFSGWSPFCACLSRGDPSLTTRLLAFLKRQGPKQFPETSAAFWGKLDRLALELHAEAVSELKQKTSGASLSIHRPAFDGTLPSELATICGREQGNAGEQEIEMPESPAETIALTPLPADEKMINDVAEDCPGIAEDDDDDDDFLLPEDVMQSRLETEWWGGANGVPVLDFGAANRGLLVRDKEGFAIENGVADGVWQLVSFRLYTSLRHLFGEDGVNVRKGPLAGRQSAIVGRPLRAIVGGYVPEPSDTEE